MEAKVLVGGPKWSSIDRKVLILGIWDGFSVLAHHSSEISNNPYRLPRS